jgi:hypothetical protein
MAECVAPTLLATKRETEFMNTRFSTSWTLCFALFTVGCGSTVVNRNTDAASDSIATDATDAMVASDVHIADAVVVADTVTSPEVAVIDAGALERFSFFVTSLTALQALSMSASGFGGDLRYGETGPGAGLRGADRICAAIAERSMPGASRKQWRAFLSAVNGGDGMPVHAINRIGSGPWYDRLGRLLANNTSELLADRPTMADPSIRNDFPNEDGVPNHRPDPTQGQVDNHDMLTGTNATGMLYSNTATCLDWTSARGVPAEEGRPRVGHSWPRDPRGMLPRDGGMGGSNGAHWISSLDEAGCAPGVSLIEMGPPILSMPTVGSGGGYGGFYCFALMP